MGDSLPETENRNTKIKNNRHLKFKTVEIETEKCK
jgi:hypothetical protein